uniref:Uncharacterized protein n=1 Tax=Amphimedon queenslandica TaxID=400682 RepID=A0A1X7SNK2_AMPQE
MQQKGGTMKSNLMSQRNSRKFESFEQEQDRKARDMSYHKKRKETETPEEASERRKKNSESAAKRRRLETTEENCHRKQQDRACKARHKVLATNYENQVKQYKNKVSQARRRQCSTMEKAIANFHLKISMGAHNDGVTYVCKTCNRALSSGSLPAQAVANGLELDQVPAELAKLKMLEIRKQQCIHGPAVNVPSKLEAICTTLPRLPCETEILALKLKRKMAYKGHYLFDYINPQH